MAETAYFLSVDDRDAIRELLTAYRRGVVNTPRSGDDGVNNQESNTPDVYVAKTGSGGVPARSGVTPGSADDCALYRLLLPEETLESFDYDLDAVFNFSTDAVAANTFVLVTRDKPGVWWVGGSGSGGGGSTPDTSCYAAGGWISTECIRAEVGVTLGVCSDIDATQSLLLVWDSDLSKWNSGNDAVDDPEDDFVYDGGLGPITYWTSGGTPHLTIDGTEGLYVGCDGSGGLTFTFGPGLCDGTGRVNCDDNYFTVVLTCECCDVPGYTTAGWYRVLPPGLTCSTICSGTCKHLTSVCEAGNWVICDGPFGGEDSCGEGGEGCNPPPTGEFDCESGVATLDMGSATGSDNTFFQVSPGLWQTTTGWVLQSPGIDPNAGGSGTCVGIDWALYWGVPGTADPTSCVHCGGVDNTVGSPTFGCLLFSDDSGGGTGPEGGSCPTESKICCDDGGMMLLPSPVVHKDSGTRGKGDKRPRLPCGFEGEVLTGNEREKYGLGRSSKNWRLCLNPSPEVPSKATVSGDARLTCRCMGCGPRCSGYSAGGETDDGG